MRFKGLIAVALFLAVGVLFAPPAMAQEQRGAIEGTVKDTSGGVLPGVTVEARNITVGSVTTAVSDSLGAYRFPALAPGRYEVTANLTGFAPQKFESVEILLGQIKRVDFALGVAGLTETVQVSGEAPLVDVRQSARATSIREEQIEALPKGRDFTSVVTQAPGANYESKSGGIMVDGASAGENRYIVDGVETTNLRTGASNYALSVDFLEEVQVKSSGYTAEYGGATGGVINAVTKSGTNSFRGNAFLYWEGDALEGASNKTLRLSPANSDVAEYVTYPEDSQNRLDPGFSLGGPVVKNRMWFFGAYQPRQTKTTREVSPTTANNPRANTFNREQTITGHNVSANTTGQWSNSFRTRFSYNNAWRKQEGRLPALTGSDAAATNYAIDDTYPNWSMAGTADWVVRPNFFVGLRAGYYKANTINAGVPTEDRLLFSLGNVGLVGLDGTPVPAEFQRSVGYSNLATNNSTAFDIYTRMNFQIDSTFYGNLGGQHTIKGGVQIDRLGNEVLSGEQGNLIRFQWGAALAGLRGNYGYYQVRSNGVYPDKGFVTEGDVSTNNIGLFIQDAWTINNKLTLNLGLRTERERVPTYSAQEGLPEYAVEFDFADKLAPRLGFAYDIKGDGRWKAFGSWGVFYDIFKLELPRGSFGGDKWLEYYYSLDTPDFASVAASSNCPPACSGTLIRGPIDFRHVSLGSDAIEPDLKPMKSQEMSFGLEHQLSNVVALSLRYVHKQIDEAIEDTGTLDAQQNEIYIIANPGRGLTEYAWPATGVKLPRPQRDYDSVEFAFSKNMANNWYLRAAYLWSRLYGNYSGLSQTDENGRMSPNVGRLFDYPLMMFNGTGQGEYGLLPTDRPHQFKTQFIYMLPFGTSLGLQQYVSSGIPVTREVGVIPPNAFPMQYLGRASDGRMPVYSQTDLNLSHAFKMGGARQLQFSFNVYNLFNQRTATNRFITQQKTGGDAIAFDEADFYAGKVNVASLIGNMRQDPRFMMDNGFQSPITARVGVKFVF